MTVPNRRWFQFRLRTLLVAVVLIGSLCGYVGHEWRIVVARRQWLQQHRQPYVQSMVDPESEQPTILWVRLVLGDRVYYDMLLDDESDRERAEELFPEAAVVEVERGVLPLEHGHAK